LISKPDLLLLFRAGNELLELLRELPQILSFGNPVDYKFLVYDTGPLNNTASVLRLLVGADMSDGQSAKKQPCSEVFNSDRENIEILQSVFTLIWFRENSVTTDSLIA
jgi:hypothetical protein